jgi:glycosyltransferase involved in cell wall biosynthesis
MTTMRVIVDDLLAPAAGPARYSYELTRSLIDFAPPGCFVEGVVSASSEEDYATIGQRLPGLTDLYTSSLARRELSATWQHGFTRLPGGGLIHSPSLFAPLGRHDRAVDAGQQIVVTIHDVAAWTHPHTLSPKRVSWHKAMARRAHKYADAVVVPTHAVADQLSEIHDFGGRVQIIGGSVGSTLRVPTNADAVAERLDLPPEYILAMGAHESDDGLAQAFAALALPGAPRIPLLVISSEEVDGYALVTASMEAGLAEGRVRQLRRLDDAELAVVLDRARLLLFPSLADGFALPVLQAFHFGTPVVHSDAPSVLEVAADAGVVVPAGDAEAYPRLLADAVARVLEDDALSAQLAVYGQDRAGLFSWQTTAERIWQLHAEL